MEEENVHLQMKIQQEEHELEQEEEESETLSLCDLPLDSNIIKPENPQQQQQKQTRRSASEPTEFFGFLSNLNTEMCSAEDVIFSGKLLPLTYKDQLMNNFSPPLPPHRQTRINSNPFSCRRRCDSLPAGLTHSNSVSLMRTSRSLDYQRLGQAHPISKLPMTERAPSVRKEAASKGKLPWYVLFFGAPMKPPREMELRDIKSRQVRRNISSSMLPPAPKFDVHSTYINNYKKVKSSSSACNLLGVLSCMDHASVLVATSSYYGVAPQSRALNTRHVTFM